MTIEEHVRLAEEALQRAEGALTNPYQQAQATLAQAHANMVIAKVVLEHLEMEKRSRADLS